MNYRAEIDGLRALAVVPVILFHAGFDLFEGGFVGVDVFFVISGYLITTIILNEMDQGRFRFAQFYERRAKRILPALLFVSLSCIPFAWFWLSQHDLYDFSKSLIATGLFGSNFYFWSGSGYFDTAAELKPLLHTWSLAVEEQYYILFPIVLWVFWKYGKYVIVSILGLTFLGSLILGQWGAVNLPQMAFFFLPSRGWEILLGAFCAFFTIKPRLNHYAHQVLSVIGIILIALSILTFDADTPTPGYFTLIPTLGAALIIMFSTHSTIGGQILSNRLFVATGLVSYSAYLWHQPLLVFTRYATGGTTDLPVETLPFLLISLIVLSVLTWKFIERPARSGDLSFFKLLTVFFITLPLTGFISGYFSSNEGLYWSIKSTIFDKESVNAQRILSESREELRVNDFSLCIQNGDLEKAFPTQCINGSPTIVLIGDSHGRDIYSSLGYAFEKKATSSVNILNFTRGGCRLLNPQCEAHYNRLLNWILENKANISAVIYVQAARDLLLNSRTLKEKAVDRLLHEFDTRFIENNIKFAWLGPRVNLGINRHQVLYAKCSYSAPFLFDKQEVLQKLEHSVADSILIDQQIQNYLTEIKNNIHYISQVNLLNLNLNQDITNCNTLFWSDEDHYSTAGEKYFAARMKKLINVLN
ncbi:acyltransferase family protein [Curvivirga sp.]|uniref:acyltransferase family protein n=1 Tax=Curvivirga sp. TaxID=2856848 RepID=UPI003B59F1B0